MTLPNTFQETFVGVTFPGSTRPVVAKDASQLITMYDDFVFDAMDANSYSDGALPAVNAVIPTAGLVNLANDAQLALSRTSTGAVTAVPNNTGQKPIFTGKGWRFLNGTYDRLKIKKGGIDDHRVMEPTLESFEPHLMIAYFKLTAQLGNSAPFYAGQAGGTSQWAGIYFPSTSSPIWAKPLSAGFGSQPSLGTWYQAAIYITYNSGAATATARCYINGAWVADLSGAGTFSGTNNTNAGAGIGGAPGVTTMNGEVGRIRRVLNPAGVMTQAEIDAIVAADYAWKMPLLLAA